MFRILTLAALIVILPLDAQQPVQIPRPAQLSPPAPAQPPLPQGTLSVTVLEKGTKLPIENAQVTMVGATGSDSRAQTNAEGKFKSTLPPGSYRLTVRRQGPQGYIGVPGVKVTSVRLNEETKTEVEFPQAGEVSGRVLDSRGEPVQGARVSLLMRAYTVYGPAPIYQNTPFLAQTNDVGEYSIPGIPGGIAFHLYAEILTPRATEALSTVAADPDSRRPIQAATFYPGSTDPSGSQSITLSDGQSLDRLDIHMVQSKSYCAEGVVVPNPKPGLNYTINVDVPHVNSGVWNDTGSFRSGRSIRLDAQGKARVCGLWPGPYRFTVQPQNLQEANAFFGYGEFLITDKDLSAIPLANGAPTFDWPGEVVIDGPPPAQPVPNRLTIRISDVTITGPQRSVRSEIPGKFTLPNMHVDRGRISFVGVPDGWYVKHIMYGLTDLNLPYGRYTLDTPGVPVKVVLDPNGARIKVKVTNDKGEPVAGSRVIIARSGLPTPQRLAGQLWLSYSDERGECSSFTLVNEPPRAVLAPGEYVVLATEMPYNQTADVLDQVWRAIQNNGTRVVLKPNTTTEVSTKPVVLR